MFFFKKVFTVQQSTHQHNEFQSPTNRLPNANFLTSNLNLFFTKI